jgi:hypothetical protein
VYSAIANAIQTVHTSRFLPPEVIVMHPRRWGWFLSLLDQQDRPLFLPAANSPMNVAGVLADVASQQVVGQMQGLPVVTDPNISTTSGSESPTGTEDIVYVLRASDVVLWESGVRARVLPETKAPNLTVLLQIYGYLAFSAARYPQSIVEITGRADILRSLPQAVALRQPGERGRVCGDPAAVIASPRPTRYVLRRARMVSGSDSGEARGRSLSVVRFCGGVR